MKKLILLVGLLLAAGLVFAQSTLRLNDTFDRPDSLSKGISSDGNVRWTSIATFGGGCLGIKNNQNVCFNGGTKNEWVRLDLTSEPGYFQIEKGYINITFDVNGWGEDSLIWAIADRNTSKAHADHAHLNDTNGIRVTFDQNANELLIGPFNSSQRAYSQDHFIGYEHLNAISVIVYNNNTLQVFNMTDGAGTLMLSEDFTGKTVADFSVDQAWIYEYQQALFGDAVQVDNLLISENDYSRLKALEERVATLEHRVEDLENQCCQMTTYSTAKTDYYYDGTYYLTDGIDDSDTALNGNIPSQGNLLSDFGWSAPSSNTYSDHRSTKGSLSILVNTSASEQPWNVNYDLPINSSFIGKIGIKLYDDGTDNIVYLKLETGQPNQRFGMGIDTRFNSDSYYCYEGINHQNCQLATVARSVGWHTVVFNFTSSGIDVSIDGTKVDDTSYLGLDYIQILVGTEGGVYETTAWFDEFWVSNGNRPLKHASYEDRIANLEAQLQQLQSQNLNSRLTLLEETTNYIMNILETLLNQTATLFQGWNLASSPYPTVQNVSIATHSLDGCYQNIISFNGTWQSYSQVNPMGSLKYVYPDLGYWIKVNCSNIDWTIS